MYAPGLREEGAKLDGAWLWAAGFQACIWSHRNVLGFLRAQAWAQTHPTLMVLFASLRIILAFSKHCASLEAARDAKM